MLSLLLLQDARRPARLSPSGEMVLLKDQDRTLWDGAKIARGVELLDTALAFGQAGIYRSGRNHNNPFRSRHDR
ncbi:MAG: DUF6596 domain-containing protein [Thermomicrobiales bacterium]